MTPIEVKAAADESAEVRIYDSIGSGFFEDGVTAKAFADALSGMSKVKTINVRINSPGGAVFEGLAIYNTLKNHPAKKIVHVDGMAASIASVVAMAGDEIRIAKNGFVMVHEPSSYARGKSTDLRRIADMMDKVKNQMVDIYVERTGQPKADIEQMVSAETWMDSTEAKAKGFATDIGPKVTVAASFDLSQFSNAPDDLKAMLVASAGQVPVQNKEATVMSQDQKPVPATVAELKALPQVTSEFIVAKPVPATVAELKALPQVTSEFIVAQIEAGATFVQAQSAWMAKLAEKVTASNAEVEQLKAKAALPGVQALGSKAGATTEEAEPDAVEAFDKLVQNELSKLPVRNNPRYDLQRRQIAVKNAVAKDPALHAKYIEQVNRDRVKAAR